MEGAIRDLWLPGLAFGALATSFVAGAVKLFTGPTLASPLAISVLWAFYGAVPSFLALYYGAISRGPSLAAVCRVAMVTGLAAGTLAVFLMWGLAPKQYDFEDAADAAARFFDARRVGRLPVAAASSSSSSSPTAAAAAASIVADAIPWRGDALLQEAASPLLSIAAAVASGASAAVANGTSLVNATSGVADVAGGWLNGGGAGNLKLTTTTAFAVSLLSWARIAFPGSAGGAVSPTGGDGSSTSTSSDAVEARARARRAADAARWGADWLLKASGVGNGAGQSVPVAGGGSVGGGFGGDLLVAQVGNATADALFWGRPEDIAGTRPAYAVSLSQGAADLASVTAAALASASVLLKRDDPAWSASALARAEALFAAAERWPGFARDQLASTFGVSRTSTLTTTYPNGTVVTSEQTNFVDAPTGINGVSRDVNGVVATPSMHDKLLWGAAWLYRATANETYLKSANEHFVKYLYQEGGGKNLAFTPQNYFWAANVLLAATTDGGTFHERARYFLRQWACAEGDEIRYSPRGRAIAGSSPTLGTSAAAAFLAAVYGDR